VTGRVYRSANLRTLGIGESAVSELLGELTQRTEPYIGTYAKDDGVHVRITAAAQEADAAEAQLREVTAEVQRRLGQYIYADDERTLAQVLIGALQARSLTIGIMERGSGGRFGSLLLSEPASDGTVKGAIAGAGGSDPPTARAVATSVRDQLEAAVGVGIVATVQSAPHGLVEGTIAIAIVCDDGPADEEVFPIRAAYPEVQRRAALHAADVLRRALERR
jgi:nicotinamide-nucleotide amidase